MNSKLLWILFFILPNFASSDLNNTSVESQSVESFSQTYPIEFFKDLNHMFEELEKAFEKNSPEVEDKLNNIRNLIENNSLRETRPKIFNDLKKMFETYEQGFKYVTINKEALKKLTESVEQMNTSAEDLFNEIKKLKKHFKNIEFNSLDFSIDWFTTYESGIRRINFNSEKKFKDIRWLRSEFMPFVRPIASIVNTYYERAQKGDSEALYQFGRKLINNFIWRTHSTQNLDSYFKYMGTSLIDKAFEAGHPEAIYDKAVFLFQTAKDRETLEKSEELILESARAGKTDLHIYGEVLFNLGRYEEAIEHLLQSPIITTARIQVMLGESFFQIGKYRKAAKWFFKSTKSFGPDELPYYLKEYRQTYFLSRIGLATGYSRSFRSSVKKCQGVFSTIIK